MFSRWVRESSRGPERFLKMSAVTALVLSLGQDYAVFLLEESLILRPQKWPNSHEPIPPVNTVRCVE
jgi:hypothetical protein